MVDDYEWLFEVVLFEFVEGNDLICDYLFFLLVYDYFDYDNYDKGDVYYWGVWYEEVLFFIYKWVVFCFMSEYGFQFFLLLDLVWCYVEFEDWLIELLVMQFY